MATAVYKTKVRKGGVLGLPKAAREQLSLREGDEVEVTVSTPNSSTPVETGAEENPLLALAGIGKGGKPDGGINHDKYLYYLYGSDPM